MTDDHQKGPGEGSRPVPRDLPDQQARPDDDPWEAASGERLDDTGEDDVPDTDEAGTGRQGAPRSGTEQTEHPVPDEPSA
ncbi:hypothetical protein [Streptomyces sp. NPDC001480]|uniref:hypothetical protein n=1 Tax=Streptomyces sp. NPDC001480 TaxID=3364577 RepID=UPI00368DA1F6